LGTAEKAGKSIVGSAATTIVPQDNMNELKKELEKAISQVPNFEKLKNHIIMTVTPEGLRIELIEGAEGTFFDSGSPRLNSDGQDLLATLAQQLAKLPNKLSVEGHTDAKPYTKGANYSNWELSADRANSARRLIQQNGIGPDQVTQVIGYADQKLRKQDAPLDPSNRRISLIVHYLDGGNGKQLDLSSIPGQAAPVSASPNEKTDQNNTAGAPTETTPNH
jgi:chemotaxis protein MotB